MGKKTYFLKIGVGKRTLNHVSLSFQSRRSRGWNPQLVAVWNQFGALYGIEPQEYTFGDAIRLWQFHTLHKCIDAIPSLRLG